VRLLGCNSFAARLVDKPAFMLAVRELRESLEDDNLFVRLLGCNSFAARLVDKPAFMLAVRELRESLKDDNLFVRLLSSDCFSKRLVDKPAYVPAVNALRASLKWNTGDDDDALSIRLLSNDMFAQHLTDPGFLATVQHWHTILGSRITVMNQVGHAWAVLAPSFLEFYAGAPLIGGWNLDMSRELMRRVKKRPSGVTGYVNESVWIDVYNGQPYNAKLDVPPKPCTKRPRSPSPSPCDELAPVLVPRRPRSVRPRPDHPPPPPPLQPPRLPQPLQPPRLPQPAASEHLAWQQMEALFAQPDYAASVRAKFDAVYDSSNCARFAANPVATAAAFAELQRSMGL